MSYKLNLIKAHPNEMKFLASYAYAIGAKVIVDDPDSVGFIKERNEQGVIEQYGLRYPVEEDAIPPGGVDVVPGLVAVQTEDNLNSKKLGILGLYQWAHTLNATGYLKINFVEVDGVTETWLQKKE